MNNIQTDPDMHTITTSPDCYHPVQDRRCSDQVPQLQFITSCLFLLGAEAGEKM